MTQAKGSSMDIPYDYVVIGAGLAGITASRLLKDKGKNFVVLEKSRGLGGRMATRRFATHEEGTEQAVDTGAQYFTVSNPIFKNMLEDSLLKQTVLSWEVQVQSWNGKDLKQITDSETRYICPAGMTSLAKDLAQGLPVLKNHKVIKANLLAYGVWQLEVENADTVYAKKIISSAPVTQSLDLFAEFLNDDKASLLREVVFAPCLAVLIICKHLIELPFKAVFWNAGDVLSWVADDSSKRLAPKQTIITAHCSPNFSAEMFISSDTEIQNLVLKELSQVLPASLIGEIERIEIKKWKLAKAVNCLGQDFYVNPEQNLFLIGDWCIEPAVEAAFNSAMALERLI
jgi:renalase